MLRETIEVPCRHLLKGTGGFMVFSKVKRVNVIHLFLILACILGLAVVFCFRIKANNRNNYFFDNDITIVEYEGFIVPLSGNEIRQRVILNIIPLEKLDNGDLYILKLDALEVEDPLDQISSGHETLGYFFVTSDVIYRSLLPHDKPYSNEQNQTIINHLKNDPNAFLDTCDIVFSKEGTNDITDKEKWHKYVEVDGEKHIFHLYNDYAGGTRYYEEIVWEKNKGITYYKSGSGSMLMHIEFGVDIG